MNISRTTSVSNGAPAKQSAANLMAEIDQAEQQSQESKDSFTPSSFERASGIIGRGALVAGAGAIPLFGITMHADRARRWNTMDSDGSILAYMGIGANLLGTVLSPALLSGSSAMLAPAIPLVISSGVAVYNDAVNEKNSFIMGNPKKYSTP